MFVRAELVDNGSPRRGNWLPELVANSPACNGIVPRGPRKRYVDGQPLPSEKYQPGAAIRRFDGRRTG